ncbi:RagB/SusD family nutrient uptake outer membrane protein [Flavobacterium sp. F-380]|uniref:RagB/SusD family nutrient uptake outer membrane protein n=1 Tax=Flavobacterium kayseriense TaxID=2764714 RepID=A0ABR7JAN1_9FLAO|nr:RagB/SusD family nutrient uptake outer membrane protein [Flavobacterium kayseriense]MBC5842592.1 RagB/SusD family nutrient uptake outer membrane protein [Flavobacterium kayseriense]MBC5849122.1 RagB/SusD family nutrient uptake outer membrane protein [Flavobacterium kayseriense]
MKKIFISMLTMSLFFTSCNDEFLDPTLPSQEAVLSTRGGLIGAANGLQQLWSTTRLSPVYTIITANGFTTNELRLINAGNADEGELSIGGVSLTSKNALTNNLWSQCLVINSESQKIIDNVNVLTVESEKASIFVHASIFKAMALGTLIQFYESVPIKTMSNSPFNSRAQVLAETIATLKATESYLSNANGFTGLISSIKYKNTVNALLARYYMMAGELDNALTHANVVDLTSKSTFTYDAVSNNPIAFNSILTNNVYQPLDRTFGLPSSLAPVSNDGRVNFYITTGSNPATAAGFFNSNTTAIPVYLPGEITLIKAEVYARKIPNMLNDSKMELDKVLTKTASNDAFGIGANLPAYTGTMSQASLLTEIYRNRCIELFMSGLKLEDSRRFSRPANERNRTYYPYPDSERFNNTNTPADPAN